MSIETVAAVTWAYTTLSGDATITTSATGGVWQDAAPQGTPGPLVIVAQISATDQLTANANRLYVDAVFKVVATGPTKMFATLASIGNRIDALLGRTNGTSGSVIIQACYREQVINISNLVNGESWAQVGGLYRLAIQ